jgi:hypothetical protein
MSIAEELGLSLEEVLFMLAEDPDEAHQRPRRSRS